MTGTIIGAVIGFAAGMMAAEFFPIFLHLEHRLLKYLVLRLAGPGPIEKDGQRMWLRADGHIEWENPANGKDQA